MLGEGECLLHRNLQQTRAGEAKVSWLAFMSDFDYKVVSVGVNTAVDPHEMSPCLISIR